MTTETKPEIVLPELREVWWEHGVRARASAGPLSVLAGLPRLSRTAIGVAWQADRVRLSIVAVTTIVGGLLATFGLLATQQVLVELFAGGPTADRVRAALPALLLLAGSVAVRGALGITSGYAENGLTPRVSQVVTRRLLEVTSAVRLNAFDEDAFADDMERGARGADSVVWLVQGVLDLFAGLVSLLAVAVAVATIHPLLIVALLVATLPRAWATLAAGHLRYQAYVAGSVRRRRLGILRDLMATRDSATELRAFGLRRFLLDQFDRVMWFETAIQLKLARRSTTMVSVGSVIGGVAVGGVYALLGLLLVHGQIPLSAAATCVVAIQAAQRALNTITYQVDRIYDEGQHFSDYTGFMERAAAHTPATDGLDAVGPLERLTVSELSLTYPDRPAPAVDHVTLTIHKGQTVAFVGENGSGKSTLAALVAGLRVPTSGLVAWNGRPLGEIDPAALRRRVAVVTQDYYHWPFTAATNIALGDADAEADRERIEAAAGRAVAHEMIMELPYGYDTLLDRTFAQGQDLSGGQWQRVTAARGFLRDADLLILDEPSSALDPRAEDALFQAIRDRQGTSTTILITHRLANVRHADIIYVMDHGHLVEQGSHSALLALGGRYAELFTLQARGYTAD